MKKISKSDDVWEKKLSPEEFYVLRKKGTERSFSGKLLYNKKKGIYTCAACENKLFDSKTKFDSGTGWPSFYDAKKGSVILKKDFSMFLPRTEVLCSRCGSHLGHVFNDGPKPTEKTKGKAFSVSLASSGKRYCMNSVALGFVEKEK